MICIGHTYDRPVFREKLSGLQKRVHIAIEAHLFPEFRILAALVIFEVSYIE